MDEEVLTLSLNINDNPLNDKVDSIEKKITSLKALAENAAKDGDTSSLPGYDESMTRQLQMVQANLDNILRTRKALESAGSSFERDDLASSYKRQVEVINKALQDIANSKAIARTFASGLSDEMASAFTSSMRAISPKLATAMRQSAMSYAAGSNKSPISDDRIVENFMSGDAYKKAMKSIRTSNPSLYSDQNMKQYLRAIVSSSVPQYLRSDIVGTGESAINKPESFRSMLPKAFQTISTSGTPTRDMSHISAKDERLTKEEQHALFDLVRHNRYAADNAVQAGIIGKHNGRMIFNPSTTRHMVNAMAGLAMADTVTGAKGERKYGIVDVESPESWNNIRKKTNAYITGGLSTMRGMQDAFGPWLDPAYYSNLKKYTDHTGGRDIGAIQYNPKAQSRAFAEYTLDQMDQGWQISGLHPIIEGKTYRSVTGPMAKGPKNPVNRQITPDDWHTITLEGSMAQDIIESTRAASKPKYNDFSDNAIYLKLDEALSNPRISDAERAELQRRYAERYAQGYTTGGHHYSFTRFNKTHAEFLRDDILEELGRFELGETASELSPERRAEIIRAGREQFTNGIGFRKYDNFKAFAKDTDAWNKMYTDGENLRSYLGTDFSNPVVVVSDFSQTNKNGDKIYEGMNGVNLISGRLTPQSFQGRAFGGKATFERIDVAELRKIYGNHIVSNADVERRIAEAGLTSEPDIQKMIQQYGDLVIPGAGIVDPTTGRKGDLVVPWNVDVIEDIANIKNKSSLKGLNQAEMNARRSAAYRDHGIYAKATYDNAATGSRWLSHQLVSAMNGGFNDPEVEKYFSDVFFSEFAKLDDDQYVRRLLFNGDQNIDLKSAEAQDVIRNYENNLWNRWSQGDKLLPVGQMGYRMAGLWAPNLLNKAITDAGGKLTAEQFGIQIPDDAAVLHDSMASMLGMIRYPATGGGNISAKNMARSTESVLNDQTTDANGVTVGEKFRKLVTQLGMDPKGLYFAPDAPILKAMQGEDFDGDINGVFSLSGGSDPVFEGVMQKIFKASQEKYKQITNLDKRTTEQIRAAGRISIDPNKKDRIFDSENPYDMAEATVTAMQASAKMGGPSRISSSAWQYGLSPVMAQAMRDSEVAYDVVSVYNKAAEEFHNTRNQWAIQNRGRVFEDIFGFADKSATSVGQNENGGKRWDGQAQALFNQKKIDEINLPSVNIGSTLGMLTTRMLGRQRGKNVDSTDDQGNVLYNWDAIFANLPKVENPQSLTGQMTTRLREIKKDILNGEYIALSDATVKEIESLANGSLKEIQNQVKKELPNASFRDQNREVEKRFRSAGGEVARNVTSPNGFVLTESRLNSSPAALALVSNLLTANPNQKILSDAKELDFYTNQEEINQAQEQIKKNNELITKREQEIRTKQQKAQVTMSATLPPQAQIPFIHQPTPSEDAERRLKEAGVNGAQRKALLGMPETALRDAINNGDVSALTALHGIGEATAQKAIKALAGSSIANIVTTPKTPNRSVVATETVNIEKPAEPFKQDTAQIQSQAIENDAELKRLKEENDKIQSKIDNSQNVVQGTYERIRAQEEYAQLISGADDFSKNLWSNIRKSEDKLAGKPQAFINFDKNQGIARAYTKRLESFMESDAYNSLSEDQKQHLSSLISGDNSLKNRVARDFSETSVLNARDLLTSLESSNTKVSGTYDPQIEALQKWEDKINEVAQTRQKLQEMSADESYSEKDREQFTTQAEAIDNYVTRLNAAKDELQTYYKEQKALQTQQRDTHLGQMTRSTDQMYRNQFGLTRNTIIARALQTRDSYLTGWENQKNKIDSELYTERNKLSKMSPEDERYKKTTEHVKQLESASAQAGRAIEQLNSPMGTASVLADQFGNAIGRVAQRLGRQLFNRALQETRKFVQEFDKAMTEIQMITLKSDQQISDLGSKFIQTALDSGTTVSDVTSAASNLYRQGLSDEEVDERLDDVLKFAKVAGIKTQEASKIITTALQNGLVDSSSEAMDALVALGDTAATTASEIAKGMQKSAASAKQAGMSYGELVTLLTIGTAKTQLGGSSIGSALQTMIYRLYKVNKNEDFFDENGNHIATTDATKALSRMGISLFDEGGNFRGPYQILQDIASGWENADDVTQSAILSTLGAGRQRSNVATLIQGLAEDNGEIAGRYLNTAENSQGITDQKYEAYLDSLEAKLNQVKTSWDQLINAFNVGGAGSGALDFVSGMVQGLSALIDEVGSGIVTIPVLTAAVVALGLAMKANPVLMALGAGAALIGTIGTIYNSYKQTKEMQSEEYQTKALAQREQSAINATQHDINRARELYSIAEKNGGDVSSLSESEQAELSSILNRLGNEFGNVSSAAKDLAGNFSSVGTELNGYQKELNDYSKSVLKRNIQNLPITDNINDYIGNIISPEVIGGLSRYMEGLDDARFAVASTTYGLSGGEALGEHLRWDGKFNDSILPVAQRLFIEGKTGIKVGSMDDYYAALTANDEAGKKSREVLYEELKKTSQNKPEDIYSDYVEFLKESTYDYAENILRKTLSTNGVFNQMQVDEIVSGFIKNVLSVFTDFNVDDIENVDLASIVSSELQKISEILENDSLSSGVASYSSLESDRLNAIADSIWEQGEHIYELNGTTYYDKDRYAAASENASKNLFRPAEIAQQIWKNDDNYSKAYEQQIREQIQQDTNRIITNNSLTSEDYERQRSLIYDSINWDEATEKYKKNHKRVITDPVSGQDFDNFQTFKQYVTDHIEDYSGYYSAADEVLNNMDTSGLIASFQNAAGRNILIDPVSGNMFSSRDDLKKYVMDHPDDYRNYEISQDSVVRGSHVLDTISASLLSDTGAALEKTNADRLYEEISALDAQGLDEIFAKAEAGVLTQWETVLKSSSEFGKILQRYITENGDGTYTVNDEDGYGYGEFMSLLTQSSQSYTGISPSEFITRGQRSNKVSNAFFDWLNGESAFNASADDLKTVFGADIASKITKSNADNSYMSNFTDLDLAYMTAALGNYSVGRQDLSNQQRISGANTIYNMLENGQIDQLNKTNENVLSSYMSGTEGLDEYYKVAKQVNYAGDAWENYSDQLAKAGTDVQHMNDLQKKINQTLKSGEIDLKKTGDYADDYANSLKNLSKGGITATKELAKLRSKALSSQDIITATEKSRGKSGKQLDKQTKELVAGALGLSDTKDLERYTQEELDSALNSIEKATNEEFAQGNLQPLLQNALDTLQSNMDPLELQQAIHLDANMEGDLSIDEVAAAVEQYDASLAAALRAYEGILAEYHARVTASSDGKGNGDVLAVGQVTANLKGAGSKGGYNRRGGGGGGGGKSAAQKAIEDVKHNVSLAQHNVNMTEADMYIPDRDNNFNAYASAVQTNIAANEQLGNVYQSSIASLEAQLRSVKKGSDDWWSLTDAINGYKEALKKLAQTIDETNKKLFEESKEQYGYKINKAQHGVNMTGIDRTFYGRTNNYDAESKSIEAQIQQYNQLGAAYREAVGMYKALQNHEYQQHGQSDYWHELDEEINSVTESLAELKNTMASLDAERLNIVTEKQENADKPENNAYSMMDLYKTRYLNTEDYTAYEKVMDERKTLLKQSIQNNSTQVAELEALLKTYEEGSDEWLATRDQIWTVKLDTATKENEAIELEKELAEQRLAQIAQSYERNTSYENHANTMLQTYGQMYEKVSDYSGYRNTLNQQVSMYEKLRKSAIDARNAALEQMGSLQKNTPEWYNARDAVYQYEEAIATATASIQENEYAIEQSLANELIEHYNDDMSLFDHETKLIQDRKKNAENNLDYAGYMEEMANERNVLVEQTDSRSNYLAELQNRLANTTIGTDTWKNLRKEVLSVEEALSSAQVSLENFENEMEKTKIDFYLEKMNRAQNDRTHALTMIQYEETKYQNAGEYSNYAIMLSKENDVREKDIDALKRDIELLEKEKEFTDVGSKNYQTLINTIKKKEEAIQADSNAIEKNNKLMEEAYNKVKQQRKAVEDQLDAEIKRRKEQERNQLNAEVSLQNQILATIKQRYRDEWEIQKQDMQKKKDALNEEKNLLNERLQARKEAMNEEDKYNELRELQNQLALISNDPTRTKEMKEMQARISKLQQDLSWDRAANETEVATERIDDQITAIDEWVSINDENLNYMLEDAHNFVDEVNSVLTDNYEDIVTWMMDNNTEFRNSLDEAQQQMIDGWQTTWKTMHGIVDTYWNQINEIMSSKDNFIEFMQQSIDYINASETGKATMMYAWSTGYDNMINAERVSSAAENYIAHEHEEDGVNQLVDDLSALHDSFGWVYDASLIDSGLDNNISSSYINDYNNIYGSPASTGSSTVPTVSQFEDTYAGVGKKADTTTPSESAQVAATAYEFPKATAPATPAPTTSNKSSGTSNKSSTSSTNYKVQIPGMGEVAVKASGVQDAITKTLGSNWTGTVYVNGKSYYVEKGKLATKPAATTSSSKTSTSTTVVKPNLVNNKVALSAYASGGLVDYTGPAWVDGTKQRPEAFLNPIDTENIRGLLDMFNYIRVTPNVFPSSDMITGNHQTVGDINITINQAELNSDADINEVANKVGRAFTRQLSKQGLNLTGYSF